MRTTALTFGIIALLVSSVVLGQDETSDSATREASILESEKSAVSDQFESVVSELQAESNQDEISQLTSEESDKIARLGTVLTDGPGGAYVTSVFTNSPAHEAGIQSSDLITSINETEIKRALDVHQLLKDMKPGDSIEVHYIHNNENKTVAAALVTQAEIIEGSRMESRVTTAKPVLVDEFGNVVNVETLQQRVNSLTAQLEDAKKQLEDAKNAEQAATEKLEAEGASPDEKSEAEPTQAEPTQAEPTQAEPIQAEPAAAKPTKTDPTKSEGVDVESTESNDDK